MSRIRTGLTLLALLAGAALPAAAQETPTPQATAPQTTATQIAFDSLPDPVKLPPNLYLGEVSGVSVDSKGNLYVFSRGNTRGPAYAAAAAQLLEFDPHGNFKREIGHNLYAWSFAHTVKIDHEDNIWATDKGSDMVIEFDQAARVKMVFGRKQEASDEDTGPLKHPKPSLPPVDGMFRQVTDITWDRAGNGYISDGYINARVARIAKDGTWTGSFGTPGSGAGELNTPHSIASDANDLIYVADRGNRRIQVFNTAGQYQRTITIDIPAPPDARPAIGNRPVANQANQLMQPGAPWAICISPGPKQYLYVADSYPGRIYKLSLDGKVLGMLGQTGKQLKQFGWVHEMACPAENTLYVAELLNWRVQKLALHPTAEQR